ncbi:MAG TPA: hypothetical protein VLK36_02960 [Gaiellaceae bacterium]|nr:hypothetical protein [Gaiellaceae bacterium]
MRNWSRDDVTFEQKATAGVLAFGALVVAGWLAADSLSSSSSSSRRSTTTGGATVVTVTSVRTVRRPGPVVTRDVSVTNRLLVRSQPKPKAVTTTVVRTSTAFATSTVYRNLPAAAVTHVVTAAAAPPRTVTRLVTTVQWRVITIAQKASTVTVTVPAP